MYFPSACKGSSGKKSMRRKCDVINHTQMALYPVDVEDSNVRSDNIRLLGDKI